MAQFVGIDFKRYLEVWSIPHGARPDHDEWYILRSCRQCGYERGYLLPKIANVSYIGQLISLRHRVHLQEGMYQC